MRTDAAGGLLVVDTDLLIDYLRDQPGAVAFLEDSEQPLAASVITIAELSLGVRDGEERQQYWFPMQRGELRRSLYQHCEPTSVGDAKALAWAENYFHLAQR